MKPFEKNVKEKAGGSSGNISRAGDGTSFSMKPRLPGTQSDARGWRHTLMELMRNAESSYFLSGRRVTMASGEGQKYWQKRFFAMMNDAEP